MVVLVVGLVLGRCSFDDDEDADDEDNDDDDCEPGSIARIWFCPR